MPLRLKDVDLDTKIEKDDYEKELKELQMKLLKHQLKIHERKKRAIIMFEGWDAAGKGGAIRRLTERMDPRGYNVYPIGAPTPEEQGRHYLWRFWDRVPAPGEIAIFDRSWYGRVCVERIEKYCSKEEWKRAYGEINAWERMMVDSGCPLIKLFVHISQDEQLKRFHARERDKFKRWKIGKDDWRNRKHAKKYTKAYDDMFEKTHTAHAPWTIVAGDWKWWARIQVLRTVEKRFDELVG